MPAYASEAVKAAYQKYPGPARKHLRALRALILKTAAATPGVGKLEETLKWGEPAYLTSDSGSGSTIRLGWSAKRPDYCAVYLNCRTTLVDDYRTLHPELDYDGNRAICLALDKPLPIDALAHCIGMALTYHLNKRQRRRA